MARQYSLRSFLRLAPNKLLRRYLRQYEIGEDVKWNELREKNIEPVFRAIAAAPDDVQVDMNSDFREVEALADDGGIATLIQEGKHPNHAVDLVPTFDKMSGHLERAFWTFLEHRSIFDVARRLDYADGRNFEKRGNLPIPKEPVTSKSVPRLKSTLSEYYKKQGRGPGCQVENYTRDQRKYYFCFLEDFAKTEEDFDDTHELKVEKRRPSLKIMLIYDPAGRTLESKVDGGKEARAEVERIFGRACLGVDLGEPPEAGVVYELSQLLSRDWAFSTVPEDGIARVTLRRLKLLIMGREHRSITLEVGASAPDDAIYDLVDDVLSGDQIPRDLLTVKQAVIRLVFEPDKYGKRRRRSFTVSHPNSCTLKCDPADDIAKTCLKRWAIDISESAQNSTAKPGQPAQYKFWP